MSVLLNGKEIVPTWFPDNTCQVWKLPEEQDPPAVHLIIWEFENMVEYFIVSQLKILLDKTSSLPVDLLIRFLPFARQDKDVSNHTTFGLHSFAPAINLLRFNRVFCLDPHSRVPETLIHRFHPTYPKKIVDALLRDGEYDLLCFPDAGAHLKYSKVYPRWSAVVAAKKRDQSTGEIVELIVPAGAEGKKVLIIDDICDGGATFVRLAEALTKAGVARMDLFVTYGLFSKGLTPLFKAGLKRIFTYKGEVSEMDEMILYKPWGEK